MIRVAFEGGSELAAALKKLSTRMSRRVLIEGLTEAAEPMRKTMGTLAPKGDPKAPNLHKSMSVSTSRGQDAQEAAVAVGPSRDAFYGSFVELGTVRQEPKPFARPAFDAEKAKTLTILARVLWRELAARGIGRSVSIDDGPVSGGPGGRTL